MAWAEKRSNGKWRAGWRDGTGQRRYSPARYVTKKAAESAGWANERDARVVAAAADPKMTWSSWKTIWLDEHRDVAHGTLEGDLSRIGKYIEPKWGRTPLEKITTAKVRAWVRQLGADGVAPGSVHKIYHLLGASMTAAVEAELLTISPCRNIALPDLAEGHELFYEPYEIDAIVDFMARPYDQGVELLVQTGMRIGELAGWHWQHVDLLHRRTDIATSWSRSGSVMTPTKGRKKRSAPLTDRAMEILESLPRDRGTCGQRHEGTAPCRSTLVLPSPEGLPLDSHNMLMRHWYPALELVDVPRGRLHDLRHTYASWNIQRGVPISDIAEAMGHSDAFVTRRYAHLADKHLDRIRAAMNAAWSSRPVPSDVPSDLSERRSGR